MVKRLLIECGWLTEETTFIRDKETGQVIHAVEEPLVKHVGHGSANKKKK